METIKIIWRREDGMERVSYEMIAGDMIAASRIFADLIKQARTQIEAVEPKNLGPSLPIDARSRTD